MMDELRFELQEHFVCLFLDARRCLLAKQTLSLGSMTAAVVQPREVFRAALKHGAVNLIAVHNHPSGDPKPSAADTKLTCRLQQAGELLGIKLLDHIIVGDGCYYSFSDAGRLG
jgi:DNA repair protein RadC